VGVVAQQQYGLLVNDYQASPYAHPSFVAHLGATAVIAEPLLYRERLVGVMTVDNHATTLDFAAHDRGLLGLFAAQAAIAVANAQLFAEAYSRSAILEQTNKALQNEIRERLYAEAALQASAQFLQLTLDALPEHIAILDNTGTLIAVNAAWRRFADENGFTGTAHGIGMKYLEVCAAVTDEAAVAAQAVATGIREVLMQQRTAFFYEYPCHSPGEQRWFLLRVAPFTSPEGLRVVVVHENVTELKQAEARLQRQQEALLQREKLAAMGSLLANVAHELNNPLSVVMVQADLLREETSKQALEEQAMAISQAAERCMHIVRNFLALARQSPPQRLAVQLNTVVGEALQLLAYTLRLDNIDVSRHLADDLPLLWADPHQLQQVVINLLTNAHHALCEVSIPRQLTVTTRFDPIQAQVRLEIADTGSGMPPEVQARIFEPFFTTKAPGVGTGLGLSLCQGIIESHGGTMSVESQAGRGTVFHLKLPVEVIPVAAVDDAPPTGAVTPLDGQARAILVVDDEAGIARALAYLLRRDGHHVDTAANGRLALAQIQERSYDLVLCDLRMPELDGPGLYRALEACAPYLLSRFIFLTGDILSPEAETFFRQTGVPRLTKPFRSTEVRQVVQRELDSRQTV
jgi:two-component system NtrC family sensor kinase